MTIAERIKEYYESDDFKDNYAFMLLEDNEACIDRIQSALSKWIYFNDYTFNPSIKVDRDDAERIYEHMCYDSYDYIEDFSNYYVGDMCIDSVSFGEQEEQLTDIYNSNTGKTYSLPYLKKCFDDAGFYVHDSGKYAYYDLSDTGIMIKLKPLELPFINEIIEKYKTVEA